MPSPFQKKFKANLETFTDRTKFKKLLADAVETPQSYDEHRIKVIYGLGGQGKSYLREEFFVKEYLKKKAAIDKDLIYCDGIDFEHQPTTRSSEVALLTIAKELIEKAHIPLPAFTLAFLKLKQMNSLATNLESQYPYLFKITTHQFNKGSLVDEALQEIIDFAVGSGISEIAASVPLVGFFAKKLTSEGKNRFLEWRRISQAKDILDGLDDMDHNKLLHKLPMYLGWDFYQYQQATSVNGIPKKRLVIIIDGYETLWSEEKNRNLGKDLWVRELVEYMTGALFVIFGREALLWHEIEKNQDVINGLEQLAIDGFDDEDANDYLTQVPIIEEDIRKAIIKNAKGSEDTEKCFPQYLSLEAITYEIIMNSGRSPTAEDFAQGNDKTETEIVTRLFKHMHPALSGALEALSLCKYIDDEIIEIMEREGAFAPSIVSVKTLSEYSFVVKEGKKIQIHGFIRNIAAEQYQKNYPVKFQRIHKALFTYFENKLDFNSYKLLDPELESYIGYAAFHLKEIDLDSFPDWIRQKAKFFYGNTMSPEDMLTNQLLEAVDQLEPGNTIRYDQYEPRLKLILGELFYLIATRYDELVNRQEAERWIGFSLRAFESLYPKEALEQAKELFTKGELSQHELEDIERYKLALEKRAELCVGTYQNIAAGEYFSRANNLSKDFKLSFNTDNFMQYLSSVGRYSEAEAYFFKVFKQYYTSFEEIRRKKDHDQHEFNNALYGAVNAAGDLAKVLRSLGRYAEAKKYNEFELKMMTEVHGPDYLYTTFSKHGLAKTLIREGLYPEETKRLLDEIRVVYEANYSANHLYTGYLYAMYFEANKDTYSEELMHYYLEANRILANQPAISRELVETILVAYELTARVVETEEVEDGADSLIMMQNVIVDMFVNKFEKLKNLYGVFSPSLHKGMRIAASILADRDEVLKGDELKRKAAEFERLMNYFSLVRVDHEETAELSGELKLSTLELFREVMSLPDDPDAVTIEIIRLPFYKTADLFRIKYVGLEIPATRFVLSDLKTASIIDHTNAPLYNLGETDLFLTRENALSYGLFFFDTTTGRHGHFHMLRDSRDIPWEVDKYIPEEYKNKFTELIKPFEFVSEDEEAFKFRGNLLFKRAVFNCILYIRKEDGIVSLDEEEMVSFYRTEDGDIGILDPDSPPDAKIQVFTDLNASVDPIYEHAENNEYSDTLSGHIMGVLDIMQEDMLYIHQMISREGEDLIAFQNYKAAYNEIRDDLAEKKGVNLPLLKKLIIYNYNSNVYVYNNFLEEYEPSHRFAENLRSKMKQMDAVLTEIQNYMDSQAAE